MSRSTQYIGLTQAALDFVEQCQELPSELCTYGMFDEEIPLRRWAMHPVIAKDYPERGGMEIREVQQEVPWSSGPMIFTCLELDWGNGGTSKAFEWVHDPTLGREFCQQRENEEWAKTYPHEPCRVTVTMGEEYDREKGTTWA